MAQFHPIFYDIYEDDLQAVQQRVLADAAVPEERYIGWTPLMLAIERYEPAIALWIIQHRGQHDVNTANSDGRTALHWACRHGQLQVVQALVAAGADPAALTQAGSTPLMHASDDGRTDTAAFLLQLPAVKATIDHIDTDIDHVSLSQMQGTALTSASLFGHQPIVQLLLDAGADPTIPAGDDSHLYCALLNDHHAVAALLRPPVAMADIARALHKVRALLGAGAAALACLQGRVEQGQALPRAELTPLQHQQQGDDEAEREKQQATAAFAAACRAGRRTRGCVRICT